ncbi:unnamed protein product [Tuber aestivum]|uniref:Uncharacterized protein n=1 Tax=Tuber aestivum TaxID=59557 RepID=A0A292PRD2_9PEZI|nr:unnamed protein product [Tuber aestivum]
MASGWLVADCVDSVGEAAATEEQAPRHRTGGISHNTKILQPSSSYGACPFSIHSPYPQNSWPIFLPICGDASTPRSHGWAPTTRCPRRGNSYWSRVGAARLDQSQRLAIR